MSENYFFLKKLYQEALVHRTNHDCSAYPYAHSEKLGDCTQKYKAREILEIGTGMGFTAVVMALGAPEAKIDTIEKDPEHARIAQEFINSQGLQDQIAIIAESAEQYLPQIKKLYDLIFFDGYQIHNEFLPQYHRLLKPGGILFLANNHLKSKTSDQFFEALNDQKTWKILEQFADTTIAQKI